MNTESICETLPIARGLLTFVICEAGAHTAFKILVGVLSTVQNSIFSTGLVEFVVGEVGPAKYGPTAFSASNPNVGEILYEH
jgi:hypothetical protein